MKKSARIVSNVSDVSENDAIGRHVGIVVSEDRMNKATHLTDRRNDEIDFHEEDEIDDEDPLPFQTNKNRVNSCGPCASCDLCQEDYRGVCQIMAITQLDKYQRDNSDLIEYYDAVLGHPHGPSANWDLCQDLHRRWKQAIARSLRKHHFSVKKTYE